MDDLKAKLEKEIQFADWNMLQPHHTRGALFVIENLELSDVGVALAQDHVTMVKQWLDSKQMQRPTDEMVNDWKKTPNQKLARFLIVQPYVLMKLEYLN